MQVNNLIVNTHPKLAETIKRMIIDTQYPFYGEFNIGINFKESEKIPTAAVYISKDGSMNFLWNKDFFDSLSQKQTNFLDLHEIFHLLFSHPQRTVRGSYDSTLANYVQDMIINSIIVDSIDKDFIEIPTDSKGQNSALFIPKEYNGPENFESLYNWLKDEIDKRNKEKDDNDDGDGSGGGGNDGGSKDSSVENGDNGNDGDGDDGNGKSGNYGKNGKAGDKLIDCYDLDTIIDGYNKNKEMTIDVHMDDEVSKDVRDSIVKDLTKKITESLKMRGHNVGNLESALERLQKKRKNYLKNIKKSINNDIFGDEKFKTILRENRKNIFGLKGNKKNKSIINCVLDTSGSMVGEFEKTLAFIFRNDVEINLIQVDTKVHNVKKIKRMGQLQKTRIKGLGGTILQPGIDRISEDPKLKKYNTVILTDGYTDSLDFSKYSGKVLLISTQKECPIKMDNGKLKQIIIEKD